MVTSSQTMMRMTCRLSEVWRRRKDCLGEADLIIDRYYTYYYYDDYRQVTYHYDGYRQVLHAAHTLIL